MYAYTAQGFLLPIAVIAAETTRTTRTKNHYYCYYFFTADKQRTTKICFLSYVFSSMGFFHRVCVCVCVCIENKKIVAFVSRPNKKADDIGDFRIIVLL